MPIRAENRDRYPDDWDEISGRIKADRAKGRCECNGECGRPADHLDTDGRCRNRHGAGHDCSTCPDCIHHGRRCCGCYDGACCREGES